MALKQRKSPFDCEHVEATSAAAALLPTGEEVIIRLGTVWRSAHPIVALHPEFFCELGAGQTTPPFWPEREVPSS